MTIKESKSPLHIEEEMEAPKLNQLDFDPVSPVHGTEKTIRVVNDGYFQAVTIELSDKADTQGTTKKHNTFSF